MHNNQATPFIYEIRNVFVWQPYIFRNLEVRNIWEVMVPLIKLIKKLYLTLISLWCNVSTFFFINGPLKPQLYLNICGPLGPCSWGCGDHILPWGELFKPFNRSDSNNYLSILIWCRQRLQGHMGYWRSGSFLSYRF